MTKRTEQRVSSILGRQEPHPVAVLVDRRDYGADELAAMAAVVPEQKGEPEVAFWPLFDRVIVVPDDVPETAGPDSAIIAPETSQEPSQTGVIIDAGLGARDTMRSHGVRLGDRVMWARYAGINGPNTRKLHPLLSWKTKKVHMLMVKDLLGNFGAPERFESGEQEICVDDNGIHFIKERTTTNGNA